MKNKIFLPNFFSIKKLEENLNIFNNLNSEKNIVTFNQFSKINNKIRFIFIFNEYEAEIPLLITYCVHFNIQIYNLKNGDIEEIKKQIKHARLLCIIEEDKIFCELISKRISEVKKVESNINLLQFDNMIEKK